MPRLDQDNVTERVTIILSHLCTANKHVVVDYSDNPFTQKWEYEWADVKEYVDRCKQWMQCGNESFIVAMSLIQSLEQLEVIPTITQRTVHRVFLVALVLAIKMLEDLTLCNRDFAKVGCLSTEEFNAMELCALKALGFNTTVSVSTYERCRRDTAALSLALIKTPDSFSSRLPHSPGIPAAALTEEDDNNENVASKGNTPPAGHPKRRSWRLSGSHSNSNKAPAAPVAKGVTLSALYMGMKLHRTSSQASPRMLRDRRARSVAAISEYRRQREEEEAAIVAAAAAAAAKASSPAKSRRGSGRFAGVIGRMRASSSNGGSTRSGMDAGSSRQSRGTPGRHEGIIQRSTSRSTNTTNTTTATPGKVVHRVRTGSGDDADLWRPAGCSNGNTPHNKQNGRIKRLSGKLRDSIGRRGKAGAVVAAANARNRRSAPAARAMMRQDSL